MVAGNLAKQVQKVHADVKNKLEEANAKYKTKVDKHRCFKVFDVGDKVMVFISLKQECKGVIANFNK